MSSSRQSATLGRKRFVADTEGLSCPECGKETLVWEFGDCTLLDGTVVPNLEYMHCTMCGENLFDLQAMQRIREVRKNLQKKDKGSRLSINKRESKDA